MSAHFIKKRCLFEEERLLAEAEEHWIHIVYGLNWLIILGGAGYSISYGMRFYTGTYEGFPHEEFFGIPLGYNWWWSWYFLQTIGVILFFIEYIGYLSREIVITDQRFIMKTGLIFIDIVELDLGEIRNERVDHKLLGAWLEYGTLKLDARFVNDLSVPAITHPNEHLKVLHKARDKLRDSMENS